jgi:hypothetical protein
MHDAVDWEAFIGVIEVLAASIVESTSQPRKNPRD